MRCKSLEKAGAKHFKKGLWSPDEDQKLTNYVMNHGHSCWTSVPVNAGLQRNGKSCRLRWINYLRPGLKRGAFSLQEDETILTLHGLLGNKWSQISQHLPGRTDNEIKNYWHSHLKKRVATLEHLQDAKFRYPNTNMASAESSSSWCVNPPNFTDSFPHDTDRLAPPASPINSLPKILFADWISLDEFQRDFRKSSSDQSFSHGSESQATLMHNSLSKEGSTNESKYSQNYQNDASNEDIFHNLMPIDQIFSFNDGNLDIEDFMYM